jgi:hypothetical protein
VYGKNWGPTYLWPYLIGAGAIVLVVGLVLRSRDIIVIGLSIGIIGPIAEVAHYWYWEGLRRLIDKFIFKRDGR